MESRIIKRTILGGGDSEDRINNIKHYQVYRGLSPTTSNRYEIRIRELEDALEAEREMRLRAERGFTEISMEAGSLSDRLDEADGMTAAQVEAMRRREQEIIKLRKELELLQIQSATNESGLKKRHQEIVALLTSQLESANKHKSSGDKDKQQLTIQIDLLSSQADAANKGRMNAEGRMESFEDQLRRLKAQNDELTRANGDLSATKNKQSQEILDLQKQLHDLDASYHHLLKLKNQLQALLEETKSKLEDEARLRAQLSSQLHALQSEFDSLTVRYEEELTNAGHLKSQLQKSLNDLHLLKNKYDSDLLLRTTELEDYRRKSGGRVIELQELFEQTRNKAAGLEKDKIRLQIEIRDCSSQLDTANSTSMELGKRLKGSEGNSADLHSKIEELTMQLSNMGGEHQKDLVELTRLRVLVPELSDKNELLARENKHLTESLREALANNNDLSRQVQELSLIRSHLLAERDALAVELADAKEALREALAKLEFTMQSLAQIKGDLERRLQEKDDELERVRKTGQKAIDDLQRALMESDVKFKNELSRLKKKYDTDMREYQMQLDTMARANAELSKHNKALSNRVTELEMLLDEERRALEEARLAASNWEKRFIALHAEYDNLQLQFDIADKSRKALEAQNGDSNGRMNELSITINTLSGEKKRFESECHGMRSEMDSLMSGRRMAEEKVDKLQADNNRLIDELRGEQEMRRKGDAARKLLDAELKELRMKLEEIESVGGKEAKMFISKLEIRMREMEHELEAERRRSKDLMAENKKLQKMYQDVKILLDDRQRKIVELSSLVEKLSAKNNQLRRQIEEVEEVVGITIGKYRKGQQEVDEAQRRADNVERNSLSSRPLITPVVASVIHRGVGLGHHLSPHLSHHSHHHSHLPIRASSVAPLSSSLRPLGARSMSVSREVRRVGRY